MDNNDRISEFMGKPCTCEHGFEPDPVGGIVRPTRYWGSCLMHGEGGESIPWDTQDARAVEILPVLVAKGYCPELYYTIDSEGFAAWYFNVNPVHEREYMVSQTIAAAITAATLQLIESTTSTHEG